MSTSKVPTLAALPANLDLLSSLKATTLFAPQPVVTIFIKTTDHQQDLHDNLSKSFPNDASDCEFIIHKNVICHYSPFFSAAFNGQFSEGQTQMMTLHDIDSIIFGSFVQWMYNKRVEAEVGVELAPEMLVNMWIMAERFIIPTLQDQVMDQLYKAVSHIPAGSSMKSTLKAIQNSGSSILTSMLLNGISRSEDPVRASWIDELSMGMLRQFAKGDSDQGPLSSSNKYHVAIKIPPKEEGNVEKTDITTFVNKKPRNTPVKKRAAKRPQTLIS